MFMNDNINNYFYPTSSKAIVLEVDKNWVSYGKEATAVVHPDLLALIDELRAKRPTWRFKSTERVYNNEGQMLHNFTVYEGDEEIGTIWRDSHWRTGEARYCYNNHRLEKARQRGHGGFSTKIKVATKKILETFGTKSLDELAEEAVKKVTNVSASTFSNANFAYQGAKKKVMNALETYIEANWEKLKPYTTGLDHIDLRDLRQQRDAADSAYTARDRGESVILFMYGDKMVMHRKGAPTKTVTLDDLTEKQRAGLGMLKLMDDRAFIPDVGIRVDSETFHLLD